MVGESSAKKSPPSLGTPESPGAKTGKTLPSYLLGKKIRERGVLINKKIDRAMAKIDKASKLDVSQMSGKQKQVDVGPLEGDTRCAKEASESGMRYAKGMGENKSRTGRKEASFATAVNEAGMEGITYPPSTLGGPSNPLFESAPPNDGNPYSFGISNFPRQMNGSQSSSNHALQPTPLPLNRLTAPGPSASAELPISVPDANIMALPTVVDALVPYLLKRYFTPDRLNQIQVCETATIDKAASEMWTYATTEYKAIFDSTTSIAAQWPMMKLRVLAKLDILPSWWWYREQIVVALKPMRPVDDAKMDIGVKRAVAQVLAVERLRLEIQRLKSRNR